MWDGIDKFYSDNVFIIKYKNISTQIFSSVGKWNSSKNLINWNKVTRPQNLSKKKREKQHSDTNRICRLSEIIPLDKRRVLNVQ